MTKEQLASEDLSLLDQQIRALYKRVTGQEFSKTADTFSCVQAIQVFYEKILLSLPGHVYWLDSNLRYLGCNLQQALDAGLKSPEELIGKTNAETPWSEQAEKVDTFNREVIRTGITQTREEEVCIETGELHTYLSQKTPLRDADNHIIGLLGISTDITELKEGQAKLLQAKEMAEATDRAKSQFITDMTHDLRTPLTGIIGLGENLIAKQPAGMTEHLNLMVHAAKSLLDLLTGVIQSIKEGSATTSRLEIMPLSDIVDFVIALEKAHAEFKHLSLIVHIAPELSGYFLIDRNRMTRILLNLVGNAIKFTDQGWIKISIREHARTENECWIELVVSDSGIGIPESFQKIAFDIFTKAIPSSDTRNSGLGLGLFITRQFVKDLGGKIWLESIEGKGTSFYCHIPLQLAEDQNAHQIVNDIKNHEASLDSTEPFVTPENLNILVVDDDLIARTVLCEILTDLGAHVSLASDGKSALAMLGQKRFDLVIIDLGLPDMPGEQIALKLNREMSINQHTALVGVTAHLLALDTKYQSKTAFQKIYSKPLSSLVCREMIRELRPNKVDS